VLGSIGLLLGTAGCYQLLDPDAASGSLHGKGGGGLQDPSAGGAPAEIPAGPVDPCEVTTNQAREILQMNCSGCHQAPAHQGNFDFCLELDTLTTAVASTGKRFLVPGEPEASRLYQRAMAGEMPPVGRSPRPTTSDLSVLHEWITSCLDAR
jgi:hypothetical protein